MNVLMHNESFNKIMKLLPSLITAGLAVVLGIMLASFVWLIAAPQNDVFVPENNVSEEPVVKAGAVKNYGKIIADQHLFGYEKKQKPPAAPKQQKAAVPKPVLELFGIVARPGRESYAIISKGKKGEQEIFSAGMEVQKGVTLVEIKPRSVVLSYNGQSEELKLPDKTETSGVLSSPPSIQRSARLPSAAALPTGSNANSLPEDDLAALRDELANDPDKILQIASIAEAKDKDGNLLGFRLSPGKNRKLFRKLGLRPGDIVTQVNGVMLDSPAKGMVVMNELVAAPSITMTVKRNGQEVTITKDF